LHFKNTNPTSHAHRLCSEIDENHTESKELKGGWYTPLHISCTRGITPQYRPHMICDFFLFHFWKELSEWLSAFSTTDDIEK